jgi:hypothetical protein
MYITSNYLLILKYFNVKYQLFYPILNFFEILIIESTKLSNNTNILNNLKL